MRIAFLTTEFVTEPRFDGGLANYLRRVAGGMASRGHQVEIFTASGRDQVIQHEGLMVHRVNTSPRSRLVGLAHMLTANRLGSTISRLVTAHQLRRALLRRHREMPFDIVQTTHSQACALFLAFNSPIPIVARVSCYEPLWRELNGKPLTLNQRLREWLELATLRRVAGVYSPSQVIARAYLERSQLKVDVLPPPFYVETQDTDDSVYRDRLEGKKYLLYFGRFDPAKGIHVLVEALASRLPDLPDLRFVLVGRADSPDTLAPLRDFPDRVLHLGVLPHSQLYPIIARAHGVVLPSLVDNLPNTGLEALAFGQPVVGTRGTSFEELIEDRESGFLVEPGDPAALGRGITSLWSLSGEERRAMSEKARRRLQRFASESAYRELEGYLDRHLAPRRAAHAPGVLK